MTVRPPRSKFVSALEKRLGRSLSDQEMLRLASCARALKARKAQQQRVYKPRYALITLPDSVTRSLIIHYVPCGYRDYAQHRMELWDDGDSPLVTAVFEVPGLRPADVSVDVVDGRLVISGERCQPVQGFSAAPKTSPPGNGNGTNCSEPTEPGAVCVRASEETLAHAGTVTVLQIRELKYGFFRRVVAVPAGCTVSVSRDLPAVRLTNECISTCTGCPSPSYYGERDAYRLMAP